MQFKNEVQTKQRILNRRISNGTETLKEMFIILSHQGNVNQNDSEIPILHLLEWLRSKTQMTAYAGEDVEQGEHFSIANRSVNLSSHFGN